MKHDGGKGGDRGRAGRASPSLDPPPATTEQTPFERFEEFARKVVSVPRAELEARERAYRETHPKKKPGR